MAVCYGKKVTNQVATSYVAWICEESYNEVVDDINGLQPSRQQSSGPVAGVPPLVAAGSGC